MHPVLFGLLQSVARHLSGWDRVDLWLDQPYNQKAAGVCFMDQDTGRPVIMVKPALWELNKKRFLRVFLHEVAHAKLHAASLKPGKGRATRPVYSDTFKGRLLDLAYDINELQAETLAAGWFDYAETTAPGSITERLLALMRIDT